MQSESLRFFHQPPTVIVREGLAQKLASQLDIPVVETSPQLPSWPLTGRERDLALRQLQLHRTQLPPDRHLLVVPRENPQSPDTIEYWLCVLDPLCRDLEEAFLLVNPPDPSVGFPALSPQSEIGPDSHSLRPSPREWLAGHLFRLIAGHGRSDALSVS